MQKLFLMVLASSLLFLVGCQPQTGNVNTNLVNTNVNISNSFNNSNSYTNTNVATTNSTATISETKEPEQYQAIVQLKLEATGEKNATALPAISANVARNSADRRMEFNMPNGDKVVYLDKAGTTYLLLPNRKQYAILDKESLGFDVRQLMMPEQIVNQVKNVKGVERVGEENANGRAVIKYRYGAVTNTQTQAGQVATESFFLIDKETGLPLHSETVSESQGGNVQGYKGLRIVTEMSDIKTVTTPELFAVPTDFAKIDASQVKAQADLIFNAVALLINQTMKSAQSNPTANANTAASPMTSPTMAK
jgi:hypothetical protein